MLFIVKAGAIPVLSVELIYIVCSVVIAKEVFTIRLNLNV